METTSNPWFKYITKQTSEYPLVWWRLACNSRQNTFKRIGYASLDLKNTR